jgi:hypothetical protein
MEFAPYFPNEPNRYANTIAPMAEISQPIIPMPPYTASDTGRRKIPEPIMFPTAKAVLDQKPILYVVEMMGQFR